MKKSEFWQDLVLMYLELKPYMEEFECDKNEYNCISSLSSVKDAKCK
jgi:hypothetical protein